MQKEIDFICIGAQKSGTSWLNSILSNLEDFKVPAVKEVHYFNRSKFYKKNKLEQLSNRQFYFKKFISNKLYRKRFLRRYKRNLKQNGLNSIFELNHYYFGFADDKWYKKLLHFDNKKLYVGEITPAYACLNLTDIKHLKKIAPNCKIIFLIRNPIERAISHAKHHVKHSSDINEKLFDLNNFEKFKNFIKSDHQNLKSNYLKTLSKYLKFFSPENILVAFFDSIRNEPKILISDILKFITDDPNYNLKIDFEKLNLYKIKNRGIKFKFNKEYMLFLKNYYKNDMEELSNIFNGYCKVWLGESISKKPRSTILLSEISRLKYVI